MTQGGAPTIWIAGFEVSVDNTVGTVIIAPRLQQATANVVQVVEGSPFQAPTIRVFGRIFSFLPAGGRPPTGSVQDPRFARTFDRGRPGEAVDGALDGLRALYFS